MQVLLVGLFVAAVSASDVSLQEFVSSNTQFSASVYKRVSKTTDGNFLVSPFCTETILALVQSGCKGETAQEIVQALGLPLDQAKIEASISAVLPALTQTQNYTLNMANKIYVKSDFEINPQFKNLARDVFGTESESIEFGRKQKAAQTMNAWVENQTRNKIHNLVSPQDLNDRTKTVLLNALYFKANWSQAFPVAYTFNNNFTLLSGEVIQLDLMRHYQKYFNFVENTSLKAKFLELPFEGGQASMVVVLPNRKNGLGQLERQIDKVFMAQELSKETVTVFLPRFKIETTTNFKSVLKKMGVNKAFDQSQADLSGIAGKKGDLIIDKIAQKTFIDVAEQGVEAAAADYYLIALPLSGPPKSIKMFKANHPFIFYIKIHGVIVFAGRVTNPTA
jgi:serpin B